MADFPKLWGARSISTPGKAAPERATDVLRAAVTAIRERLPEAWSVHLAEQPPPQADRRIDGFVELSAPDGTRAVFVVEAKMAVPAGQLPSVLAQLEAYLSALEIGAVPMVVARYLSPSARSWLEERRISYADATGNLFVVLDRPPLFLRDRGADRDPWRGPGRPRGTLLGPPASRVVRALADFVPPLTVPELVRHGRASTGATYRVVEFLENEGLLRRDARGPIMTVEWRKMLERWSEDYGFQRSNTVLTCLSPRGIDFLLEGLSGFHEIPYALTGSVAAHRLAPYAPVRLAMLYTTDVDAIVDRFGLRPVDSGANVLLARGDYSVVFERTVQYENLTHVAPSQAAVDLLTGPGRSPAEGQELLEWMERHEPAWRR